MIVQTERSNLNSDQAAMLLSSSATFCARKKTQVSIIGCAILRVWMCAISSVDRARALRHIRVSTGRWLTDHGQLPKLTEQAYSIQPPTMTMTDTNPVEASAKEAPNPEEYLWSGLGHNESERTKIVDTFWQEVWPVLERAGWSFAVSRS
jgi:hypothetical protein